MWKLDYKESWSQENWCFWSVLEKTLESPLDWKEIQQSILKEISPEYSLEGLMLKPKLQYSGDLMRRTDSLEKTLMLGNTEGRRRRGQQRMRWLDGNTYAMDMSLSTLRVLVMNREAWHTTIHSVAKSQTLLNDWTEQPTLVKIIPLRLLRCLSGKESICQCRRHQFNLWSRKIPHAAEQQNQCSPTTEPLCPNHRSPRT